MISSMVCDDEYKWKGQKFINHEKSSLSFGE